MKVYALKYIEFFGSVITIGLYSTKETAESVKNKILEKYPNTLKSCYENDEYYNDENKSLEIIEYELNETLDVDKMWFVK
jgi:hypothetical protein